jgi:hypothetical protein
LQHYAGICHDTLQIQGQFTRKIPLLILEISMVESGHATNKEEEKEPGEGEESYEEEGRAEKEARDEEKGATEEGCPQETCCVEDRQCAGYSPTP